MNEHFPSMYGERIAYIYDELHQDLPGLDLMVDTLAELANGGRVLELGIGTGRVALPLAERGVDIQGIDSSEAMVAKLRAKEGGEQIPVIIGDFAEMSIDGQFSLVFVVFNTFLALISQEEQIRCFGNVADRLTEDGVFVIEAFVPDLTRFARSHSVSATRIESDRVLLDVTRHDPVSQILTSQYIVIAEDGIKLIPIKARYAWPSELDMMAQLAGMKLQERWGSFQRDPFTAASRNHVSVYKKA